MPSRPGSLPKVRKVPGVRLASGTIFSPGGLFKENGDTIGAQFSPKFISSHLPDGLESLTYVDGKPPVNGREVSLDKAAADDAGLSIGDQIRVAGQTRAKSYRLVGLTELGNASFGGASIAQLTLPQAQFITDKVGQFDQISVAAAKGVTPTELRARIEKVVPPNVRVETAQQNADRQASEIHDDLGFLSIALFVFAGVALVVGAFVIFNTFSITVAQRVREFGMLRTRRRLAAADPHLGGGGVALDRHRRGGAGAVRRLGDRPGDPRAVPGDRGRPADHRPGDGDQDGGGLAADRHRGDRAVVAEPGAALHPGPADGGAQRGGAAADAPALDRLRGLGGCCWRWSGWRWC